MAIEMTDAGLNFSREHDMPVYFKNQQIGTRRVDFLVEEVVSLEIKAKANLEDLDLAQGINYLEAYNLEVGLLINFGARSLQHKRLVNSNFKQKDNHWLLMIYENKMIKMIMKIKRWKLFVSFIPSRLQTAPLRFYPMGE